MLQAAETLAAPSIESLEVLLDLTYAWGHEDAPEAARPLRKGGARQWIAADVLPWSTSVDLEAPLAPSS